MKIKAKNINHQLLSVLLLSVFVLLFSHSELDRFTRSGDLHEGHDFCTLVKTTVTSHVHMPDSRIVSYYMDYLNIPVSNKYYPVLAENGSAFYLSSYTCWIHKDSYLIFRSLLI
jgi:hypothetical protein